MVPRALLPLILRLLLCQPWGGAALSLGHQGLLYRCNSTDCTPRQALQQQQRGHPWVLPRFAATADAGVVPTAGTHMRTLLGGKQHAQSNRRQLQQTGSTALPDVSSPAMAQWLQDSASYSQRFAKGSCFADYPGFIAKDVTGEHHPLHISGTQPTNMHTALQATSADDGVGVPGSHAALNSAQSPASQPLSQSARSQSSRC
jgi:hypothetical protein